MEINFSRPILLLLFASFPLIIFFHFFVFKSLKKRAFQFANFEAIKRITGEGFSSKNATFVSKNLSQLVLRLVAFSLLILGVAGITLAITGTRINENFVIALDASSSMLADDFTPNRLEAAKKVMVNFLDETKGRINVGVVSFSGVSYVDIAPSENKKDVIEVISDLKIKPEGGTDIGKAIFTSVNQLKGICCNENAVILITDGRSTVGSPIDSAIKYANDNKIKVYTIGLATETGGKFLNLESISTLDEPTLKRIANETEAKYFQVNSPESLLNAMKSMFEPGKGKITFHLDIYLVMFGIIVLFIEWFLGQTRFRSIP
jgi:Ca-activated chloride channel homolog